MLKHSQSVGCINRKLWDSTVRQEFRHYLNKENNHRFLMLSEDSTDGPNGFMCWITDGKFFFRFLRGMLNSREITETEFSLLTDKLSRIGVVEDASIFN